MNVVSLGLEVVNEILEFLRLSEFAFAEGEDRLLKRESERGDNGNLGEASFI